MKKVLLVVLPLGLAGLLFLSPRQDPSALRAMQQVATAGIRAVADTEVSPAHEHLSPPESLRSHDIAPAQPTASRGQQIQRIKDDYDELTVAVLGGLGGNETGSAGPSDTLLRQLALLDQERRRDIAATMTSREFEDLERKETTAGRLVDRAFKGTNASDDQRREVFRLQREFELQFEERRDAAPLTYLEREQARQTNQERIRAVLGDELFRVWLTTADDLYAVTAARAVPPQIAQDLMRARDDYNVRVLTLAAMPGLAADQRRAVNSQLAAEARQRATAILGPKLYQTAHAELLTWLPPE